MGRVAVITSGDAYERSAESAAPCLFLLFEPGTRPDANMVRAAVSEMAAWVSHDPSQFPDGNEPDDSWLELLLDGLTFDLLGLSPGPPLIFEEPQTSYDGPESSVKMEAIGLAPGPHIASAANAAPVVRSLMQLASRALLTLGGKAIAWQPAQSVMGRDYFVQVVDRWVTGGPFPALGMVSLHEADDGTLRTEGLHFFTGQELVIDAAIARDRVAATRIVARLVDELVFAETLSGDREALAPDGTVLCLRAMNHAREILVTRL